MQVLILAGGRGTRLWPLSRAESPKQLLAPLDDEKSLLVQTAERVCAQGIPSENIHLVTTKQQAHLFQELWKGYGGIIEESAAKNTGPAVLLGVKYLLEKGISSTEAIAVFPSDHYISDFCFNADEDCAQCILCYRIIPTRPETGYGYIQTHGGDICRKVEAFKEKPDALIAQAWFDAWKKTPNNVDNKFWNSGIYVFSVNSLSYVLKASIPDVYALWQEEPYDELIKKYSFFPQISFDVLVAEKADNLYSLPLPCSKWRDIGTWESVHEALRSESSDNVAAGKASVVASESAGNLAFSKTKKTIAFAGVSDLAVIDTGDAILVADKKNSTAMKELLDTLAVQYKDLC